MTENTVRVQELIGRRVRDARGRSLGRVYDLVAEADGDDLVVAELLVGPRAWRTRFGWTTRLHGRRVRWEQIAQLSPEIVLDGEG